MLVRLSEPLPHLGLSPSFYLPLLPCIVLWDVYHLAGYSVLAGEMLRHE